MKQNEKKKEWNKMKSNNYIFRSHTNCRIKNHLIRNIDVYLSCVESESEYLSNRVLDLSSNVYIVFKCMPYGLRCSILCYMRIGWLMKFKYLDNYPSNVLFRPNIPLFGTSVAFSILGYWLSCFPFPFFFEKESSIHSPYWTLNEIHWNFEWEWKWCVSFFSSFIFSIFFELFFV